MAGPQDYAATAAATAAANKAAAAKAKASASAKPKATPAQTKAIAQANALIDSSKTRLAQLEALQTPAVSQPSSGVSTLEQYAYNTNQNYNPLTGEVTPKTTDKAVVPEGPSQDTRDAFATMGLLLKQWGLEGLADTYGRLMTQGLTAGEALTKLKYDKTVDPVTGKPWNQAYSTRFAGNVERAAKGLNAYDEATYLDMENSYRQTLQSYGLSNLINPDKAAATKQYASYMANDLSTTEFATRIKTVAEGVINMDKATKDQFKTWYPTLTDTDLVSYFLDPKQSLPVLQNKVNAIQIGAVANTAGYAIDEARATELSKFGVDRASAIAGYQNVAEVVPTATKLSGIYNEEGITYGQTAAEDEFLKQDAQAKLKRNRLASKERAMFQGQSGVDANSLARGTTGLI